MSLLRLPLLANDVAGQREDGFDESFALDPAVIDPSAITILHGHIRPNTALQSRV